MENVIDIYTCSHYIITHVEEQLPLSSAQCTLIPQWYNTFYLQTFAL